MAEKRVATDDELVKIFPDLEDDSVATDTVDEEPEAEAPQEEPEEELTEEDSQDTLAAEEDPEVATEEVDQEEPVETDESVATEEEVQAEKPQETDLVVKPEWDDLDKDALIAELARVEAERRMWQGKHTKQNQMVVSVENAANGMKLEELTPILSRFNEPEFVEYIAAYINGRPAGVPAQVVVGGQKTPDDFMPEGEEYDSRDIGDVHSNSYKAFTKYNQWVVTEESKAAERQVAEQQEKEAIQRANTLRDTTVPAESRTSFDKHAAQYADPEAIMQLVIDDWKRSQNKRTKVSESVTSQIQKIRANKGKTKSASTVGGESPSLPDTEKTPESIIFGDM